MKRNVGLDILKFICSFMVICIHIRFPEPLGSIFTPITRMAVPIFFMITGYFYSSTKEKCGELKQIKKIGVIFVVSNAIFFLYSLCKNFLQGNTLSEYCINTFNLKDLLKFSLLNESPFGTHLWYLGAILYVLIIVFLFEKNWDRKKLYPIIPVLLLVDLVFGKYSLLILGREFPYALVRNFLFVGLPYFLIGDLLNNVKPKFKTRSSFLLTILFALTTLIESFVINKLNMNVARDHYISTTFLAVFAFLCALNSECTDNNWFLKKVSFIGRKLTLYIYIIHPIFIFILRKAISVFIHNESLELVIGYMCPFVVFAISILSAWIFDTLVKKVKKQPTKL